jgi:hypothetical protein
MQSPGKSPGILEGRIFSPAGQFSAIRGGWRPATGVQIGTRWPEAAIASIDGWMARQNDPLGHSEAIRRLHALVEIGLKAEK